MSSKKDKLLESALKFIAKGQLDRAIKDYEQVVALDPGDIRHRQRLAELLIKVTRKEEAVKELQTIGKFYADNAYYLKAIAVYKQIQKLEPSTIATSLTLAELNAKQGLIGNALIEYNLVFNHRQKGGDLPGALDILGKMLAVDPENLSTKLKIAETHFASGQRDEAYEEFTQLALLLMDRGDTAAFSTICDRIQSLFPDRNEFILDMLTVLIERGDAMQAIARLQELLKKDTGCLKAWRLLVDAHRSRGDEERVRLTFQHMIRFFPEETFPREGLLELALDKENIDEAWDLVQIHVPPLLAKRVFQPLERFYLSLLERSPGDKRILEGLKGLYGASGEQEKLAEVIARESALMPPQPEPSKEEAEDVPKQTEAPSLLRAEPEAPWEEEIDLSFIEQTVSRELPTGEPERCLVDAEAESLETEVIPLPEIGIAIPPPEIEYPAGISTGEAFLAEEGMHGHEELLPLAPTLEEMLDLSSESLDDKIADKEAFGEPGEEIQEFDISGGVEAPVEPEGENEVELELEIGESDLDWLSEEESRPESPADVTPQLGLHQPDEPADLVYEVEAGTEQALFDGDETSLFGEDEFFDLGVELLPETAGEEPASLEQDDKYSFDGLFSQFKKGIDEQLDKGDTETHYNLGIAYKEMGLFDDAIVEFEAAAVDPQRTSDCLALQGMCYRDKGDFSKAEEVFKTGLAREGVAMPEQSSLKYELGLLFESAGRGDEALQLYREVQAETPDFRDTVRKIAVLEGKEDDLEPLDLDLLELELEEEG